MVTDNFPASRRRSLDLENHTSKDFARKFVTQSVNMQITIQPPLELTGHPPLNLAVPTHGSLEEGQVSQFYTEGILISGENDTQCEPLVYRARELM